MTAARATSSAQTAARWRAAVAIGLAVLVAHAWLLGLWPRSPGPGWRAEAPRPLQVRQIRRAPAPGPTDVGARVSQRPALPPLPTVASAPPATAGRDDRPAVADAARERVDPAQAAAAPGGADLPVYATRVPPPFTLTFDVRRGPAAGQATLRWETDAAGYALTLQARAPGQRLAGSSSHGGFDAAGLAPERYVESRRGRELRASNFQRDAGRITYSGPPVEHPLVAGAQDRLSWIVQLAAVLAANPALAASGESITMFVAGARGDAEAWVFVAVGPEVLDLPSGERVETLKLQREPRRPYDTQVQVWVDPARLYLPARLHLAVRASGEGSELLLRSVSTP